MGVGRAHHTIALDLGVGDLTNDVLVGETDNQTILGRIVLVLVLDHKTTTSIIVGLAL